MRRQCCLIRAALACLFGLPATANANAPLTLDDAFAAAVAHHPALAAAQANVDAAEAHVGVARLPRIPTAGLELGHTQTTANFAPRPGMFPASASAAAGASTTSFSPEPYPYWQASLTGRWNAWDFGRTSAAIESAENAEVAAKADLVSARLQLWQSVATAFLHVQAAEAQVLALDESERQVERYRDVTKAKVDAQIRPMLDLAKAESDLAAAKVATMRARDAVASARVALASAMGDKHTIAQELAPIPVLAAGVTDTDLAGDDGLERLTDSARRGRPELASLQARRAQAEAQLASDQKAAMPTLYVAGQVTAAGIQLQNLGVNVGATLGLSVPLSALWTVTPALAESRARLRGLSAQEEVLVLGVRTQLDQARTALTQARKRLPALATLVAFAETARKHAEARYNAGASTLTELSDAQTALSLARVQAIQAGLEVALAQAALVVALGRP